MPLEVGGVRVCPYANVAELASHQEALRRPHHAHRDVGLATQQVRDLNKSTGQVRIGADVARERQHEAMSEALKPIRGMTAEQRAARIRRARLDPAARLQCARFDISLADAERAERTTPDGGKAAAQRELFDMRRRYRALGC